MLDVLVDLVKKVGAGLTFRIGSGGGGGVVAVLCALLVWVKEVGGTWEWSLLIT